ncbi:5-oxoprolinase subunit C family protein [Pedococcus sp. P5_B7]
MTLEVLTPGPFTTVQDLGRPGLAHLGVGESGAADRRSLRLANRLVGNPEGAPALEATFGGLTVRFDSAVLVALTGAPCPVTIGGRGAAMYAPLSLRAGETLRLGMPEAGLRTYLAVRGGIDVPCLLGSRSTDTMASLGPAPLSPGAHLPVGATTQPHPSVDIAPQAPYPSEMHFDVVLGPRDDWFTAEALAALRRGPYTVTDKCDRVGLRLDGPVLTRRIERELKPEGTVAGALQVPPNGQPILFLADHPVTGGYPVIAVVTEDDLHLAAQARPGQRLWFGTTGRPRPPEVG